MEPAADVVVPTEITAISPTDIKQPDSDWCGKLNKLLIFHPTKKGRIPGLEITNCDVQFRKNGIAASAHGLYRARGSHALQRPEE